MKFFSPCPPGSREYLLAELEKIGAGSVVPGFQGARFEADLQMAYVIALNSRFASRILLELKWGSVHTEDDLYKLAKDMPWEQYLSSKATIACRATGLPKDKNPNFAVMRLKDAVVDRFRDRGRPRPKVERSNPDIRIEARWNGRQASIYLNWTGDALHERGYRLEGPEAVLRETTASSLLAMANWKNMADGGSVFVDPVCGGGTLLAEAALMAVDAPVGILRKSWGFLPWTGHDNVLWLRVMAKEQTRYKKAIERLSPISGYDISPGVIKAARNNLRRAGLDTRIALNVHDIKQGLPADWPKADSGLIFADPPYGIRSREDPAPIYAALGSAFKTLPPAWRMALLAPDRKIAAMSFLKTEQYLQTVSGGRNIVLGLYERMGGSDRNSR